MSDPTEPHGRTFTRPGAGPQQSRWRLAGKARNQFRRCLSRSADGREDGADQARVVAFSTSGDAELGDYDDELVIFFKAGTLPAQFEG